MHQSFLEAGTRILVRAVELEGATQVVLQHDLYP